MMTKSPESASAEIGCTSWSLPYLADIPGVYNRGATLQTTSEAVAGLEHTLSWRPPGNLIVSTQWFGFEGGGAGKTVAQRCIFREEWSQAWRIQLEGGVE